MNSAKIMNVICIFAAISTLLVASSAYEEKKANVLKFWNCMSCIDDPVAREEYLKCAGMKPEKCKTISLDCIEEVAPGLETPDGVDGRWETFCKAENDEPSRYFDCIMNHELRKELSEDEKTTMKEFFKCLQKLDDKYCHQ